MCWRSKDGEKEGKKARKENRIRRKEGGKGGEQRIRKVWKE